MHQGTLPWLGAPNRRAPTHVGLSRSFKLRVFCHQQCGASSKASQAAPDPEQAFWSSTALLGTAVPARPSLPGSRTSHTATAKGNRARGRKANTSPSRMVIGRGQSSGLAAGPCLTFFGLSAGGNLSGRRVIVERKIGGSRDAGDRSSLRFYLRLCMARQPWNPNQRLLIKHRGEARGVKGRAHAGLWGSLNAEGTQCCHCLV